nr:hypothetical protein [Pelagibacterium sediminicola]
MAGFDTRHDTPPFQTPSPISRHSSLEVVDHHNDSHVWDNQFQTDSEALDAALNALNSEGAGAFMRGNNVVQFPRP